MVLNEILKFDIKSFKENNTFAVDKNNLRKYSILMRESELMRIVKCLNQENEKPLYKSQYKSTYPFIKDLLIVDIDDNTDIYKTTIGIITFNDVKYKRIIASSGNIRSNKITFIAENLYDRVNEILLCGLSSTLEHNCFAKFSSYYALCGTDSIPVTMPNIIIVDDYKHTILDNFDVVKEIGKDQYEVENNAEESECEIMPFDGAGLVEISLARQWAFIDLNLNYIPSSFQIRVIPCLKGNLYTFDIRKFAEEKFKDD